MESQSIYLSGTKVLNELTRLLFLDLLAKEILLAFNGQVQA